MNRALVIACCIGCSSAPSEAPEPVGPVTVRVMRGDDPVANATVVFGGLGSGSTDADGRITADTDGTVTVIDPDGTNRLFTVTSLHAADFVEVPLEVSPVVTKPPVGTLAIAAAPGAPAETHHYTVETPCGVFETPSLPATFPIARDCFADGKVPVIITAATENLNLENPGHGLAFVAGLATGDTDVTFAPGVWSQACTQVDAFIADRMQITFMSRLGGRTFRSFPDFCSVGAPADGFTYAYPVHDFGEGATTTSFGYVSGSLRTTTLLRNFATLPTRVEVGRTPALLVGDIALTSMTERGATRSRDRALDGSDAVLAKLTWITPDNHVVWKFLVAGDVTEIDVPTFEGAPAIAGVTSRIAELRFLDASWLDAPALAGLTSLDHHAPEIPAGASLRGYTEQFFPDAD